MGRVDDLKAAHRAELELAELEDELVKLKAKPGDGKKLRETKDKLRAARQAQREARESA